MQSSIHLQPYEEQAGELPDGIPIHCWAQTHTHTLNSLETQICLTVWEEGSTPEGNLYNIDRI